MNVNQLNRLSELRFLSGDLSTQDAFTELYEQLLNECQVTGDMTTARAMQAILLSQAQYLLNEWLQGKREAPEPTRLTMMEHGKWN